MAHFLAKLAAVGGGTAAAGGGIVAGASSIFGSRGESVEKPKIKNQTEETPDATLVAEESTQTPPKPSCIIWEARDPGGSSGNRQFRELVEKHESKEDFFQKWGSGSERAMNDNFKTEIENACQNKSEKRNVNGKVYVWWGTVSGQQKWIYAGDMHKGDHDWETEISPRPSGSSGTPAAA
ncbi:hypothetical protein MHF_1155 [Mycoplasma haemofelis Ohio2]|uniref:Uncharacterized protein n=1 Tax=Mycoplasma haemofelis (strain Ohio2) TaxID=859194 RepID=F6FJP2_MYCHI|nr:hypothetical protein MHF_1155 [Mycoplasma haemofelis Ohio2]